MKQLFCLSFFFLFGIVAVQAQNQQIKLQSKENTIKEVFKEVEKQTQLSINYNQSKLNVMQRVKVSSKQNTVAKVIKEILKGTKFTFTMEKNHLIIVPIKINNKNTRFINVKGIVKDYSGEPLIGVSIGLSSDKTKGTITGFDGTFLLTNVPIKGNLIVSYIGYRTQKKVAQPQMNILLKEDTQLLDEVVVVGYGSTIKKDLTGAVATVNLSNTIIEQKPSTNVLQAIKGNIPGLNISQASNSGGVPSFSIRGTNSISASGAPLVVVDGFIGGSIGDVNPHDIESVTVLKDAASAAVYGSQAANGVILITTKRGTSEKPRITANVNFGIQDWACMPDMMNGTQYLSFLKDKKLAGNPNATALDPKDLLTAKEYEVYKSGNEIDWYKEVSQRSIIQNYQLSVDGSTKKTNYYLSANYVHQDGLILGDSFEKFSLRSKLSVQVTKWLKAGLNISGYYTNRNSRKADMYLAQVQSPFAYKYMQEKGLEDWMDIHPNGTFWSNPLWSTQKDGFFDDKNDNNYLQTNSKIDISIPWVKGLSIKLLGTYTIYNAMNASFVHEKALVSSAAQMLDPSVRLSNAHGSMTSQQNHNWLLNSIVNYSRKFNKHFIDASFVTEASGSNNKYVKFSASNFSDFGSTVLSYNGLNKGKSTQFGGDAYDLLFNRPRLQSYLGRANYSYDNRYNLTTSIRTDGSSAFAPGHRKSTFYAGAVGWTVSNEDFWKQNDYINYLKFRLSWGENGNSGIKAYSHYAKVTSGKSYIYGDEEAKTLYIGNMPNQELGWERKAEWNIGIDFSLLRDRIHGSMNYYNSVTHDLLLSSRVPIMTGYTSILENIGKVGNWGIELNLNSTNIQTKDFSWNSNYSFWMNRNKILALNGADLDKDGVPDDDIANRRFINKPLGIIYDYQMDGIVQEEDIEYQKKYHRVPGDFKTRDLSGPDGVPDGKLDHYDKKIIGYTAPLFTMSLGNTFSYKNFEFFFSLYWVNGGKNHYMKANASATCPSYLTSAKWIVRDYWTLENRNNEVPRANFTREDGYSQWGCYQQRDFLRLQDVSLSYTMPKSITSKLKVNNLKVFVNGENLFTKTDWVGLDPETGGQIGNYNTPTFKTVSFGLNVSF